MFVLDKGGDGAGAIHLVHSCLNLLSCRRVDFNCHLADFLGDFFLDFLFLFDVFIVVTFFIKFSERNIDVFDNLVNLFLFLGVVFFDGFDSADSTLDISNDGNVDDLESDTNEISAWLGPIDVTNIHVTSAIFHAQTFELCHNRGVIFRKFSLDTFK